MQPGQVLAYSNGTVPGLPVEVVLPDRCPLRRANLQLHVVRAQPPATDLDCGDQPKPPFNDQPPALTGAAGLQWLDPAGGMAKFR
jgi:hypothetical protein